MSYGFCYVIVLSAQMCQFSSVLMCHNTYDSTLFSPSTQYAVKYSSAGYSHCGLIQKVSLLNLILYSTQSLSLKKNNNEYLQQWWWLVVFNEYQKLQLLPSRIQKLRDACKVIAKQSKKTLYSNKICSQYARRLLGRDRCQSVEEKSENSSECTSPADGR